MKNNLKENCLCKESNFKNVFDSHFNTLRNFLLFRYKNSNFAEDIAQNAFIKLWENCKILKIEQAKSFLYTTAIRLSLNEIKHQKVADEFGINFEFVSLNNETPDFILEEKEFKNRLESAINSLPEKQRVVFLMNRIEKHSYNEIANLLNLSVKAIEKRMHQALLSLRKVVDNI